MHRRDEFQEARRRQQRSASIRLALLTTLFVGALGVLSGCGHPASTYTTGKASTAMPTTSSSPIQVTATKMPAPNRDLSSIHMINATTGWAFTRPYLYTKGAYVLHTTDGGLHWRDVTPKYATAEPADEGLRGCVQRREQPDQGGQGR